VAAAAATLLWLPHAAFAQPASPLAGAWTLNRAVSEMPPEIGFNLLGVPAPGPDNRGTAGSGSTRGGSTGGGRGRRGSAGAGGAATPFTRLESYDESRRVQLLTDEARTPPSRLMIVDANGAITITNELGQSRTVHAGVRDEPVDVAGVHLIANTRREADRLVIDYFIATDRVVRYTYSRAPSAPQLVVDVEFLERGAGDRARRIYEPAVASDTSAASRPSAVGTPTTAPTAAPPPASPAAATGSSAAQPSQPFDSRPGAELRGLKTLGILVEQLSAQATGCGLNHDAMEAALAKRLADDGFTVRRNSDDDTYVYVNVMTTTLSTGACVSRYDAFLYTHATANLSYRDRPVLVQVSLMHRGGMGASAPSGHAAAVTRGLEEYLDVFATQIRDANK
jgi:hypothetical protein